MANRKRKSKKSQQARKPQKPAAAQPPPTPTEQASPEQTPAEQPAAVQRGTARKVSAERLDAAGGPAEAEAHAMLVSAERPALQPAGVPLTAETADVTPGDDDRKLLADSLATLADAGFTPRREITVDDVAADSACGVSRFRRYPLVSLLGLRDLDEEPLFTRVHCDQSSKQRTTPEELIALVDVYARAAGTAEQVGGVNLLLDPGSTTSGSFRFTNGDRVNDVSFDLDADFGDEDAEMQIAADVSPEGHRPHIIFAGDTARPVVIWAPVGADLSSLDVLLEEGAA